MALIDIKFIKVCSTACQEPTGKFNTQMPTYSSFVCVCVGWGYVCINTSKHQCTWSAYHLLLCMHLTISLLLAVEKITNTDRRMIKLELRKSLWSAIERTWFQLFSFIWRTESYQILPHIWHYSACTEIF